MPDTSLRILDEIFGIVHNYPTATATMKQVCTDVIRSLTDYGRSATVIDSQHRGFWIIQVDGHDYRIIRDKAWLRYDVTMIS